MRGLKIERPSRLLRGLALVGLLLLAGPRDGQAQANSAEVAYDSSAVAVRQPAGDVLQRYRSNPAFQYDPTPPDQESWWDRLVRWVRDQIFGPLDGTQVGRLVEWMLYALAAILVIVAVLRLLRMDPRSAFYGRSPGRRATMVVEGGDIEAVDFEARIAQAVAAENYRAAVRLYYLKTLQALSAHGQIAWKPEKTNHQYADELRETALAPSFRELTRLFEYVWYGDFAVDRTRFVHFRSRFEQFAERLADQPTPSNQPVAVP